MRNGRLPATYFLAHSQGGLQLQGLQLHCLPANAAVAKAPVIMMTANKAAISFFMAFTLLPGIDLPLLQTFEQRVDLFQFGFFILRGSPFERMLDAGIQVILQDLRLHVLQGPPNGAQGV